MSLFIVVAATLLVAFVYSSVGHGGASGYLFILSFLALPHEAMSSAALILNILVSGLASWSFYKAGYFSWKLTWPFVVGSIPAAFLGGLIKIPAATYSVLLSLALALAAYRLLVAIPGNSNNEDERIIRPTIAVLVGAAIGLFSGMVGIGGGIILSPFLILGRFSKAKEAAATSAIFILLNSFAGLLGRAWRSGVSLSLPSILYGTLLASFIGGFLGSQIGAKRFTSIGLRRVLAAVLFLASAKLIWLH